MIDGCTADDVQGVNLLPLRYNMQRSPEAALFLSPETKATGRREGSRGHTHLLLALIIWSLATHPFRDGSPFLLLETPPSLRR